MDGVKPEATRNARAPANADDPARLEALLGRDRLVVIAGLAIVIAAAWVWIILLGAGTGMDGSTMTGMSQQQMASAPDHGMGGMVRAVQRLYEGW